MANNLTIESPNFEKVVSEAGDYTSNGLYLLWVALNDTRRSERIDFRRAKDIIAPRVLTISAAASVDNLDLQGCSVVSFIGTTAQNLTGFRAPDTGETRLVIVQISGTGTITAKQASTSEAANQLVNKTGADVAMATNAAAMYLYLVSKWRQVA